ncbi:S-methyl-5-thioribose-1-phosphate isomerase [Streptacidiphilus sp. PAMC 29251]
MAPTPTSLAWEGDCVVTLDQRGLPTEQRPLRLSTVDEVIAAITSLAVRGAPAIGLAGAFGVALSALSAGRNGLDESAVRADARRLTAARPTAVNLSWAVERTLGRLAEGPAAVLAEAQAMLAEDIGVNLAAVDRAAALVRELCPDRPLRILTHCNTGRLATAAVGTALGTILRLHAEGAVEEVLAGETRPLLQGARLTAWELGQAGVPHRVCTDSAGPAAMARGLVDCVLVGADRIAANGDVANKIGTYALAVAAARHRIPFLVVAPESSWDRSLADGSGIVIEERDPAEVTAFAGITTVPPGTGAYNPAFDVTPAELVTAIVTECRTVRPGGSPGGELAAMCRTLYQRGWMPGTAGNLSVRLPGVAHTALITPSGRDKDSLAAADMIGITAESGAPLGGGPGRPSAETAIHAAVYRHTTARAVIHVHSPYATAVATRSARDYGPGLFGSVPLRGQELLKGLGLADHGRTDVPVFPNWPDVGLIATEVAEYLATAAATASDPAPGLLIADHGITVWGADLAQARNRLECFEAIFQLALLTGADLLPAL